MPETAGATLGKEEGSLNYISLEELNYIFGVPTLKMIQYHLQVVKWALEVTKWALYHFILRRVVKKPQDLHVLYTWVDIRSVEKAKEARKREDARTQEETVEQDRGPGSSSSMEILSAE